MITGTTVPGAWHDKSEDPGTAGQALRLVIEWATNL